MERGRDVAFNVPCLLGSKTADVIASANGRWVYSSAAELNSRRAVYLSPYRVGRCPTYTRFLLHGRFESKLLPSLCGARAMREFD